jgi:allantoin racemase
VKEDGAEVICLGCAGMAGFDKALEKKLGVPVLDGFVCALKLLELFNQYGLRHSKVLTYAGPQSKELTGLGSHFSNVYLKKK